MVPSKAGSKEAPGLEGRAAASCTVAPRFTRTFRWNDGESTERYFGVDVDDEGLAWFEWSHRHGQGGRVERGRQSFAELLDVGPTGSPPASVLAELERVARDRHGR